MPPPLPSPVGVGLGTSLVTSSHLGAEFLKYSSGSANVTFLGRKIAWKIFKNGSNFPENWAQSACKTLGCYQIKGQEEEIDTKSIFADFKCPETYQRPSSSWTRPNGAETKKSFSMFSA